MNQKPDAVSEYQALSVSDWLAYESCTKDLLRVREPERLARYATDAKASLHQIQTLVLNRAWRWPLQYLPLMLCRGPARSGADFLRWRNQQNNRSGTKAWQILMQDASVSLVVRNALLAIERDRIVFNMQMSVLTFILRQIRECSVKMTDAGSISASVFSATK